LDARHGSDADPLGINYLGIQDFIGPNDWLRGTTDKCRHGVGFLSLGGPPDLAAGSKHLRLPSY
jgi:hypothetical protein